MFEKTGTHPPLVCLRHEADTGDRKVFIDRVKVRVKAGDGGRGCMSFRREKFVPKGGPDGGDGGAGGNVIFRVDPGETMLVSLHSKPYYQAGRGEHGQGSNKHGARGDDMVCRVPPGTMVFDEETGRLLCDLTEPGEEFVVAQAGRGGRGNARFATPTRRAPRFAEPGQAGESRTLRVELKLIAQAGLVGFPNAGKSTLIRKLTHARARIGDYPFTTLAPVLGTLFLDDYESIIIADIPGLIEGAHEGVGLGLDFLRHVERTRVLVFVVDISDTATPEPVEALRVLRNELAHYRQDLLKRPWVLACNKIDLLNPEDVSFWQEHLAEVLREAGEPADTPACLISAETGEGKENLIDLIAALYRTIQEEEKNSIRETNIEGQGGGE